MQFRNRDLVAILLVLILSRMAWNDNEESLSASVHLAFYVPNPHNEEPRSMALAPFDVDGDGTSEAMAMASSAGTTDSWKLKIFDLKPLHQTVDVTRMAPFQPKQLFESPEIGQEKNAVDNFFPLKITTGQVLIQKPNGEKATQRVQPESKKDETINDRSRHYFCGNSWHEAAEACGVPCPSGQSSDCPDDERCFADTPCDSLNQKASGSSPEHNEVLFHLTPGGGLPSIVSFWSNGMLHMHSLTADKSLTIGDGSNKETIKSKKKLELREMWKTKIFPDHIDMNKVDWEEGANIQFLDAVDSIEANAGHGMVLIRGEFFHVQEEEDMDEADYDVNDLFVSFVIAIDAMTGRVMWDSFSNGDDLDGKKTEPLPLPIHRGVSSSARRRSNIPTVHKAHSLQSHTESGSMTNCLSLFKHSIGDVLPYAHWGPDDSGLVAMHLNPKTRRAKGKHSDQHGDHGKHVAKHHDHHHLSKTLGHSATASVTKKAKRKWHHRFHRKAKTDRVFGRPNVVVTHSHGGLQIRSLKNGHMVCHLSLLEEVLYADLNSDGIIDQVQVLLGTSPMHDHFVWKLAEQVKKEKNATKVSGEPNDTEEEDEPNLCHTMALSGLPAKEELFSASLCNEREYPANSEGHLTATTPIVVESLDGFRGSRDIVIATGNGLVHRLDGATGRHEWQTSGKQMMEDFPTWEGSFSGLMYTLLSRVQSDMAPPPLRPILLAGQNSLAILSAKSGAILGSASFPQESIRRPVLTDVNGDGTTDVLVTTEDAVWGFQIVVTPGAPIILRIMVGLLFLGLMLAVVSSRTGQRNDKRSSDQ